MERGDFYVLESRGLDEAAGWRWLELSRRIEAFGVDAKKQIFDESIEPEQPVPFKVMTGRRAMDVYGCSGGPIVYSEELVRALERARCSGLRSYSALIYDRTDTRVIDEQVRWVVPTARAGPIDRQRGAALLADLEYLEADPCYEEAYGLFFDIKSWPGTDVFRLKHEQSRVLVTRRVVEVVERSACRGVQITPLPTYGKAIRDAAIERRRRRQSK